MSEPSKPSIRRMERALQQRPNAKCLIVGFDFGTTFTGVAWTMLFPNSRGLSRDQIRTIRSWPGRHGNAQDKSKVPSRLVYNAQGEVTNWGYEEAEGDAIVMEWFKLAIVPEEDLPAHLRNSAKLIQVRQLMRKLGITPEQVISDYIRRVWAHAKKEIKKSVGHRNFEALPVHVVFTVPAIWGKPQIEAMQRAASTSILQYEDGEHELARIPTFAIVSEPEAAVQAYANELQNQVEVGETLLLIDIGGGTGDAISYLKVGEGEQFYLILKEATLGDGALCGAIFVDEAFEKLLLSRLPAAHKNLKTENPAAWERILNEQWQNAIKQTFEWKKSGKEILPVRLSNIADGDVVHLHRDEIQDVFESVMPKIIRLVQDQIDKIKETHGGQAPHVILPVGGFGRCPYLLQRLREEFEGDGIAANNTKKNGQKKQKVDLQQKIEVHSHTDVMPWTCVCVGACLFGLREQLKMRLVESRISRTSVGFLENARGSSEDGGIWNPVFGEVMIPNKLTYVVRKGDSIDTGEKSQVAEFMAFDVDAKGMHTERAVFYAHDGDSPPTRFDPNDAKFRAHGVMDIKVPKPIQSLPTEDTDCGERRVFDYQLHRTIVGGSVNITAIDPATEKSVGELVLADLDTA